MILALCSIACRPPAASSDQLLEQARLQLARGHHQQAEILAVQSALAPAPSPWAYLVAAEAALKTNRYADALAYYQKVPRHDASAAQSAEFGEAEMLCHLGRLSESEAKLEQLLRHDPRHNLAHYRLAFLYNITGRRWQAQPHLLHLIKNRAAEVEHLLLLGNPQRQIEDRELLDASTRLVPDDPLPRLGAARLAVTLSRPAEARSLLKDVLTRRPDEPEANVRWGQLLLDEADAAPFVEWSRRLSPDLERHPDVWMLRGQHCQRIGDTKSAARCFWETLRRDPEHHAACHQLGRTLVELNEAEQARPFLERAEALQKLTVALDDLFHHRDHLESMRRAALLAAQLGRLWEAASWSSIALTTDPDQAWALQLLQEISPVLKPDLPQTAPAFDPARKIDLSRFPLPAWSGGPRVLDSEDSVEIESLSVDPGMTPSPSAEAEVLSEDRQAWNAVRFADQAGELGIQFQYENGADDATTGARIFETTGGGVGAIDYDQDGWPDLYFTQGGLDPITRPAPQFPDRLYRNLSGQHFDDVTGAAQLGDINFSQGLAVGDFDNDGFPDIYVANFGQNRLYHNHGDGTFSDITEQAGVVESLWTTSCLIADLNGDGLPDLYDVNYAAGDLVLTRICEKQGVTRSCSPRAFDPAPDCVWLNMGDGRFRNVTQESGIDVPNGYGLGIVALDLDGHGLLSLFVANDEVPNFLFVNRSHSDIAAERKNSPALIGAANSSPAGLPVPKEIRFEEQALLAGVALDADGKAQACMGVAADDADGDGLIDLFVTNFYLESNTLYRQIAPGQFADTTRVARLRDPSFAMLGWGTQFLDANLDGREDLIVTNGHIDDLTSIGEPYRMSTQFYLNTGKGRFQELPAKSLGSFFEQPHLGRGLCKLDWNRDGKDDIAISHLKEGSSLLTNESPSPGHHLAIFLKGKTGSRDGIGARVELTAAGRTQKKQLTAGDGYQASNERKLHFGLGQATMLETLTIHWPGGPSQSWKNIPADQTILVIEGSETWLKSAR